MLVTDRKYDGTLRERRARETRAALLSTGRRLLTENGYSGTSIEEIVASAGMTRGAFYKHFSDKEDFFEEVVRLLAQEVVAHIWGQSFELATNRRERERFAARLFVERMSAPDANRILAINGPAVLGHQRWSHVVGESVFAPLREAIRGWARRGFVPENLVEPLTQLLTGLFQAAATNVASAVDSARAAREYEDALVFVIQSLRGESREGSTSDTGADGSP